MNTRKTLRVPALLSAALLTALVGCSDRQTPTVNTVDTTPPPTQSTGAAVGEAWDKTKDAAKEVYSDAKSATMDGVDKLDRATYDERVELKTNLTKAGAEMEAKLDEWKRDGKAASPATSAKIAEARARFNDSLEDLGSATADGWATAKAKTAAAWAELKGAFEQAKAERS